jgi:hypothetical protein
VAPPVYSASGLDITAMQTQTQTQTQTQQMHSQGLSRSRGGGIDPYSGTVGINLDSDAEPGHIRRGEMYGKVDDLGVGYAEWSWEHRNEFQSLSFTLEMWVRPAHVQVC